MKRRKKAVAICLIFAMCISYLPAMTMSSMAGEKQTITLNVKSKSLTVGQKYQLSVGKVSHGNIGKEVKWKSSNSKVAEVSDKGKVSAKKAGTATITAVSKTNSKIKATCKIRVYKKVKSIVIKDNMHHYTDSQTGRMGRGMRIKLRAVIKPSGANQKVTWSSSDSSIAKVNSKGVVTGRKLGKVTITAKSIADKKITAKYEVRVVKWCLPPTRPATVTPTKKPTKAPTKKPTKAPTKKPTKAPTMTPTKVPTKTPTKVPTVQPTQVPTNIPIQTEIREIKAYKDYDYAHDGKAGLLVVEKDLKWGAISYDGQIVVPLEYKYACDTPNNEGQTFFGNDGEYKVFDRNGKEIFKTEGTIKSVSDGVVFIEEIDSETNGYRYEYIRLDGTVLYDSGEMRLGSYCSLAVGFQEGFGVFYKTYEKLLSPQGEIIEVFLKRCGEEDSGTQGGNSSNVNLAGKSPCFTHPIGAVHQGYYVSQGNRVGPNPNACYIHDINGTENYKIDMNSLCKYAGFTGEYNWKINGMNKEGNMCLSYKTLMSVSISKEEKTKTYLIDLSKLEERLNEELMTETVFPEGSIIAEGEYIEPSDEKYWLYSANGEWGYIDSEGNIKATYDDACGFVNGRAMVIIDGQAHFIDEDFQISEDSVPAYAVRTAGDVFKIDTPDGRIIVY